MELSSIATLAYKPPVINKGYANQTLAINLSESDIQTHAVTERMKRLFVGGKGFDLWMLWQAVGPDTQWKEHRDRPFTPDRIGDGLQCGRLFWSLSQICRV